MINNDKRFYFRNFWKIKCLDEKSSISISLSSHATILTCKLLGIVHEQIWFGSFRRIDRLQKILDISHGLVDGSSQSGRQSIGSLGSAWWCGWCRAVDDCGWGVERCKWERSRGCATEVWHHRFVWSRKNDISGKVRQKYQFLRKIWDGYAGWNAPSDWKLEGLEREI